MPLFKQVFDELQTYFNEILSLVNVFVYKSKTVYDGETVYVLSRKLLEGNNCPISCNGLNYDVSALLNKVKDQSDT